ncbi:MAG: VTT domain-containing protein [Rhodospirillales bacterium]|nr:VTT domain-containing protein [Rhodospirillales bacterium]
MHRLFVPGETCWQCVRADRVAFLVDAAAYFSAFKAAALRARRSIVIIGWDIDSRVRLEPDRDDVPAPDRLGDFLDHLLVNRPGLHVHILAWDFPLIYAGDRELFTGFRLGMMANRRLRYCLDSAHPMGASHHQKIVVIDDALAFVGGIDFAARRWDTPRHELNDPCRVDSSGRQYPPFHDMQVAVDGEAAAALGEIARERWRRGTGKKLTKVRRTADDPWPQGVGVDLKDVEVAIARTDAGIDGLTPIREVEALYIAAIAAAQTYIYIENQYLTAGHVGEALRASLERENGPEIVIVLPQESWDWLEQAAMDTRRASLIGRLRKADRNDRLRIYSPLVSGVPIHVHAKVMIFDNRVVRVGSANLANRSMGLDTECDVAVETGQTDTVAGLLARLVGEHLDHPAEDVAAAIAEEGSLVKAIERLRGRDHTLKPIRIVEVTEEAEEIAASSQPLLDPEQPAEAEMIVGRLIRAVDWRVLVRRLAIAGLFFSLVVALAMAWRVGPFSGWVNAESLVSWWQTFDGSVMAGIMAMGSIVVATLALVPLTFMVTAAAVAFGPVLGSAYAMLGALLSSAIVYGAGALLGERWATKLFGRRWRRIGDTLSGRGVLAVAMVRMVPVAPYSVVNFLAGALRVRFIDFILGTALGLIPGIIALSLFGAQLGAVLREPGWLNVSLLIVISLALLVGIGLGIRSLHRSQGRRRRPARSLQS